MNKEKYVFAQLISFLNEDKFRRIVNKYQANRYIKHFTCWNQLLALMFGQLSNRESLMDLIVALAAHHSKCYHLGMGKNVSKSSLARANQDRDYHIFEEYAYYLVNEARQKRVSNIFNLGGNVYAFDSTTIDLCLSVFWWAKFRKKKGGIKVHTLYDVDTQNYPEHLRLVRYWDDEQKREFVFLTNAFHISALQVAELYKNRWQVELFFKWLKQHLKIKKFWGTTENAVRIQIYTAICTYCLVAIVQKDMQLDRSTYEVLQILSISLTDKTNLRELFDRTKFQNVNDRFRFNEPIYLIFNSSQF